MKIIKKLFGSVIALAMAFALTISVSAASITVESDNFDGRTFVAYQVFKGSKVTNNTLEGIDWGNGIQKDAFLIALKNSKDFGTENPFASATSAADVANVLKDWQQMNDSNAIAFAQLAYTHRNESNKKPFTNGQLNDVEVGYYLIVDTTETLPDGEAKNPAILKVVGDEVVTPKTEKVTIDKMVKGENDTDFKNDTSSSVGKIVDFRFSSTIPIQSTLNQYTVYKWTFTDTMSKGLDPVKNTDGSLKVEVKIGDSIATTGYTVSSIVDTTDGGKSFTVTFENLKAIEGIAGKTITVSYQAKVTEDAIASEDGTVDSVNNNVKLDYSNNPNDNTSTGEIDDDVKVFTFQLEGTKVNDKEQTDTLEGAEFMLYKTVKDSNPEQKEYAVIDSTGKITKWNTLSDEAVKEYLDAKDSVDYVGPNYTITSNDDGKFNVTGLGDGTYFLKETKAPEGYIAPNDPFKIEITSKQSNNMMDTLTIKLDGKQVEGGGNPSTGIVTGTFVNTSSMTLPETGGMGTTMLYVIGGVLLVGSAILLITKKRMSNEG